MESELASPEIAPAMTYIVMSVFSSKKARSASAASSGRSTAASRSVSFVNGPVRNESSEITPLTGIPGLPSSIMRLNAAGDANCILQVQPSLPSLARQPSLEKWKVRQGPPFTAKQIATGFLMPAVTAFASASSAHRFSRAPSTPYRFTYAIAFCSVIVFPPSKRVSNRTK